VQVIGALQRVTRQLNVGALSDTAGSWWQLVPLPDRHASYSPIIFLLVVAAVIAVTSAMVRSSFTEGTAAGLRGIAASAGPMPACRIPRRDLGSPYATCSSRFFDAPRTAIAFRCDSPLPRRRRRPDLGRALCADRGGGAARGKRGRVLQQGKISTYLLYSFVTLLVLLAVVL